MCGKLFAFIFFIIALALALLASILPQNQLASIIYASRFFEVMVPVLAVGALLKYLFTRSHCHKDVIHKEVIERDTRRLEP